MTTPGKASQWFCEPQTKVGRVVEADRVPITFHNIHLMRMPLRVAGREPIGDRIIDCRSPRQAESRDPHSGFVAYVPAGSIARGKNSHPRPAQAKRLLVSICPRIVARRMAEVPRNAGHSPMYLSANSTTSSGSRAGT